MRGFILAVIILAVSVPPALAQDKEEKPAQPGTVRVAVVNIKVVFDKYEKSRLFKNELQELMLPFKNKGKVLAKQMEAWHQKALTPGIDHAEKQQLETAVLQNKRQLEDLHRDKGRAISNKQQDHLIVIWKDVHGAIKTYATQNGIQLVFGYGDRSEERRVGKEC